MGSYADDDTDEVEAEYDSGPFCRHWGDPDTCEAVCKNCGHRCGVHGDTSCDDWRNQPACPCTKWEEA